MEMRHNLNSELHFFFNLPGSCQMEGITDLYNYITGYLAGILCFVSALLAFVIFHHTDGRRHLKQFVVETKEEFIYWMRFVKNWTHSTSLELIWTIIPTFILIAIAIPSFILLYALDEIVDCQCVVKVVGYQWYWRYEYPINYHEDYDVLNVSVLSYMRPLEDLTNYAPLRLLEVDMPLVLPHSVNVKLIITSKDVLHSFAVPALGIKMDAVPGRLNQVTVFIIQPGVYYGQCSELCGVNHAYMPIVIHAISFELYEEFLMKIAFVQEKEKIQRSLEVLLNDEEFIESIFMEEVEEVSANNDKSECIECKINQNPTPLPNPDDSDDDDKSKGSKPEFCLECILTVPSEVEVTCKFEKPEFFVDCSNKPDGVELHVYLFKILFPNFPVEDNTDIDNVCF
jgi:cytochrome c oxidase subunit II